MVNRNDCNLAFVYRTKSINLQFSWNIVLFLPGLQFYLIFVFNFFVFFIVLLFYIIILFFIFFIFCQSIAKNSCEECDNLETHLFNLRKDFKENIGSRVVKAHNSQLVRLYSPTKEPAIVFFRHGVPLLYDGGSNEDEIFMRFEENKEPIARELSDENFEHLTQASSGATTGDWFILL